LNLHFTFYIISALFPKLKMATVDTENYFAIAISDDLASGSATIGSTPSGEAAPDTAPQDDKASRKAKRDERIAEAVRRSRVEYTSENVYTERGVCPSLSHFHGSIQADDIVVSERGR
jgi:hypothetical protein